MEIKNIKEYNADYHKDGTLVWKKIGEKTGKSGKGIRKKKNYELVKFSSIKTDGQYAINEDILQQSKELYNQTKEMIPVLILFDGTLLGGFEQYELAKQLKLKKIPVQRIRLGQSEFRKAVTNQKYGNKKYPIKASDGSKIFLSLNRFKKVKQTSSLLLELGYTMEIIPNFTFRVWDNDKCIIGSAQEGVQLHTLRKELGKIGRNNISQ